MGERVKMTLLELNSILGEVIETSMPGEYWVEAEIAELRESGGHCYIELIEKDEKSNTPIAKASAKCWRSHWGLVKSAFMQATNKPLAKGMKVLVKVYAQFHANYGFSWIITDIDPTYSLGSMALKRQQIIAQLKEEGVFDANKELKSSFKNYLSVADYNTAMMDLESGAVDAVAMDEFVAKKQIEGKENTYAILDESISSEQYAVGFKKGNTKLRDEVEKTLIAMVKDGTFAKISKKWFKADYGILKAN